MALLSENLTTVHIVGTILITIFGLIGCTVPLMATLLSRRVPKIKRYLSFIQLALTALGAGVVISTALMHILPEGAELVIEGGLGGEDDHAEEHHEEHHDENETNATLRHFNMMEHPVHPHHSRRHRTSAVSPKRRNFAAREADHEEEEHDEPYPYGFLFALIGLVVTFVVDGEIHKLADSHQEATMKAHITEIGVAIHSILVGVAFGIMGNIDSTNTFAIALMLHQLCEGFAMGPMIYKGARGAIHAAILVACFTLATPLGIGIGALARAYGDPESKQSNLTQGIIECFAGGMLLYVGAVEFLAGLLHTTEHSEDHCTKREECIKTEHHPAGTVIADGEEDVNREAFFPNPDTPNEDCPCHEESAEPTSEPTAAHHCATPCEEVCPESAVVTVDKDETDKDKENHCETATTFLHDYPVAGRIVTPIMVIIGAAGMAVVKIYA
eukprot:TRINITY_DN6732_c0_g1_i2.p1 TRINITY_DN6732_c0_g1~~TRINITY_DN6732_c0_g1_i2.p1  ORF type:complete len:443 (-),score=165.82 TRINITY_DN6732_c0_g1_i2:632-1960(-)